MALLRRSGIQKMLINEISYLDEIFELEKRIKQTQHVNVTNVSYWNSSEAYKRYMNNFISLDCPNDIFDYAYTYDLDKAQRKAILQKLGVINSSLSMCLVTSSGTDTILNIINFLKVHNYKKIGLLDPSYFSVAQACKLYDIAFENVPLSYTEGKYIIPINYILEQHFDVIWLTSPIYSTGVSYEPSQIEILRKLMLNKILIIADETLAFSNQMLMSQLPISDYFFCICSPHKPLFMNRMKFSVLICPQKHEDFLEQWIDVLSGSLPLSSLIAIQHFLSDNFEECMLATQRWYSNTLKEISDVIFQFPSIQCDLDEPAPYKTLYIQSLRKDLYNIDNIATLISKHYASYIPTTLGNHFGFRINLSLESNNLKSALYRILKYYT